MSIQPSRTAFKVREIAGGIAIDLRSPRRPLTAVIVAAWLVGWAVGGTFVVQQFRGGENPGPDRLFLIVWSLMWFAAGPMAFAYLAWLLVGRERVTVREGRLRIWRGVWRLGIAREYEAAAVHELRTFGREVAPLVAAGLDLAGRGASGVRFRCADRVVRFARALDEPTAHALVDRLCACHPFERSARARVEPAA